jgi:orotidine-5'-phosphate decarboxylase
LGQIDLDNPILVALDVDSREEALTLACQLKGAVGGFKVGPRLCVRYGSQLVNELSAHGHVFVDNKYLDIPSTMVAAVEATFDAGASFTTVHSWAGSEALYQLAQLEKDLNQKRPFQILAVTVLTSFSPSTLPGSLQGISIAEQVQGLAHEISNAGLNGFVCSAEEVSRLRRIWPNAFLVTPGIRFQDEGKGDQKRVVGPREAMVNGASALVIGRPICRAKEPVEVARRYLKALEGIVAV